MKNLKPFREQIDALDVKIVKLLNERAKCAVEIGKIKQAEKKEVFVPAREKEVIKNVTLSNAGPLKNSSLEAIYTEIMSASRGLETEINVSYLGPEATFSFQAAHKFFGAGVNYNAAQNPVEALKDVENSRADFAVVPVENSNEGTVNITLDMLINTRLAICGEITLEISHCLLSNAAPKNIKKIYSHPQALAQCRQWLSKHYPNAELFETSSTSAAVKHITKDKHGAAVASKAASSLYSVKLLSQNIQDTENFTRFFVIGSTCAKPTGNDKTSVAFIIKDKVSALSNVLTIFARHKINLTKIESRPTKQKLGEYVFFIDFQGHKYDKHIVKLLHDFEKKCLFLKILGSYPKSS
ncbi:MAG: prephenate dehydratase [Elusimicrobia bacterium]|nr:prephenate dehydratase [Elusimicrobiota bacterium]